MSDISKKSPDYDYLSSLNPQQRKAVEYLGGPQLVIAGAGSGKTRVLTHKIVHLIRSGIPAEKILALTFTNKAAREMQERINNMLESRQAYKIWSGTFHSIFLRILRRHPDKIGFKPDFTIYDAADSKSLIKIIIKNMGLDEKVYKPSVVASAISNAKNALVTPEQYAKDKTYTEADRKSRRGRTWEIYKYYVERCRISNSMDFDDILLYMNILLRDNEDLRQYYADWFRYVLVDEYQDTNFAQHLIVSQLTSKYNSLCVVGDDAQSIYSFRGANIGNILNLEKRYPTLKTFKLERNYRSTQNIVNAADSLISKNARQIKKKVFTENEEGDRINIIKTYSDLEEASTVASQIVKLKNRFHDSAEEFAILYRTNAQSRTIEEALRKINIPYRIYGGVSFYQRKEIKDALAYFRISVNPDDDEALRRIINYPARGIGETTMKKIREAAQEKGISLWSVLNNLEESGVVINSGTRKKLDAFTKMVSEFVSDNRTSNAFELAQLIYNRSKILAVLADEKTPEEVSRRENLMELLSGIKEFIEIRREEGELDISMNAFLSEVSLATDQDQTEDDDSAKVTLMTAHSAKGLEFNHVIVVGVEEELFPSALSMNSMSEVEEERRLLYVAITRARKTCTLTYAGSRFRNGQTVLTRPSRFLTEIDGRFTHYNSSLDLAFGKSEGFINPVENYRRNNRLMHERPAPKLKKLNLDYANSKVIEESSDGLVKTGSEIQHSIFGKGVVTKIEDFSGDEIIMVDFEEAGSKKLLLKYAKFTVIRK